MAARLGYHSLDGYLRERRAAGWTWRAMAAESGQPGSWLRRQAARGAGPLIRPPGGDRTADPAPAAVARYSWVVTALTSV